MAFNAYFKDRGTYNIVFDFENVLDIGERIIMANAYMPGRGIEDTPAGRAYLVEESLSINLEANKINLNLDLSGEDIVSGEYGLIVEARTDYANVHVETATIYFRPRQPIPAELIRHYSSRNGEVQLDGEFPLNFVKGAIVLPPTDDEPEEEEVEKIRVIRFRGVIK